jgi:choline dehydrogenase-like flavoprotein
VPFPFPLSLPLAPPAPLPGTEPSAPILFRSTQALDTQVSLGSQAPPDVQGPPAAPTLALPPQPDASRMEENSAAADTFLIPSIDRPFSKVPCCLGVNTATPSRRAAAGWRPWAFVSRRRKRRKRRWLLGRSVSSRRAVGAPPIPTYLPVANQAAKFVAERMDGFSLNAINEVLLGVPITAHILGGARMAESPEQGVVDEACRVFGHPGLWVVDGAVIPVNLGANPCLTITAVAEHAMSFIPKKGHGPVDDRRTVGE